MNAPKIYQAFCRCCAVLLVTCAAQTAPGDLFAQSGTDSRAAAETALDEAARHFATGRRAQAAAAYEQANTLARRCEREANADEASARFLQFKAAAGLAETRWRQGRRAEADSAAARALALADPAAIPCDRLRVLTIAAAARQSLERKDDNRLAMQALDYARRFPSAACEWQLRARAAAARHFFDSGDYSAPDSLIAELKSLLEHDACEVSDEARFLAYDAAGDYYYYHHMGQKALHYKRQAAASLPALQSVYAPAVYDSVKLEFNLDLARLHRITWNFKQALDISEQLAADTAAYSRRERRALFFELSRSLSLYHRYSNPNLQFYAAKSYNKEAYPFWERAKNYAENALRLSEGAGELTEIYYHISALFYERHLFEESLEFARKSLKEINDGSGRRSSSVMIYGQLAALNWELGRYADALHATHQALRYNNPGFVASSVYALPALDAKPLLPLMNQNLLATKFLTLLSFGKKEAAFACLRLAEQSAGRLLPRLAHQRDRKFIKDHLQICYDAASVYYAGLEDSTWKAFYYAVKGRAFDIRKQFDLNEKNADQNAILMQSKLNELREIETLIMLGGANEQLQQYYERGMALESEIESYAANLPPVESKHSLEELKSFAVGYFANCPDRTVISYVPFKNRLAVFVLNKEGLRSYLQDLSYEMLVNTLGDFKTAVDSFNHYKSNPHGYGGSRGAGCFEQYIESSSLLYKWLIQPVETEGLSDDIIIAPHTALWAAPWTAIALLPDSARGKYTPGEWYDRWGEQVFWHLEYPFSDRSLLLAHSFTTLDSRRPSFSCRGVSAFAPVFNFAVNDDATLQFASRARFLKEMEGLRSVSRDNGGNLRFVPLPYARQEALEVARLSRNFGAGGDAFLHEEATKERLSQAVQKGCPILHLATHAFYNPASSLSAGIVFSPDAADSLYGGVLYPAEIYQMDFRKTDLVALSACQTGLGFVEKSEGQTGLTRAFLHAGARNVLSSLWAVNDEATAVFMRAFYEGVFAENLSYAAALRRARIETMRAGFGAPYYWAGFRLIGR